MKTRYKWIILVTAVMLVILIPFGIWGDQVDLLVKQYIEKGKECPVQVGLFLSALLAGDIFLPTPSSLISTSCGALLGFFWGFIASFVGMTISCLIGYFVGAYAAEPFVRKMMGESNMKTLTKLSNKYGIYCLLVTRAVPVLAEAAVLFAGLGKERFRDVMLVVSLANLVISAIYAYIGSYASSVNSFMIVFFGGIVVPAIIMALAQKIKNSK